MTHPTYITLTTASNPGAIAIVQLHGPAAVAALAELTAVSRWPIGMVRLVRFADIDEGCAQCLQEGSDSVVQLMPHGGPHVVRLLIERLIRRGCIYADAIPPRSLFPEARSDLEADMLTAAAVALSPAALDLLFQQPALWKTFDPNVDLCRLLERSRLLDRLIHPPAVAIVGRPNVGKSTLTNRLLGRWASQVSDLPGTTRDWVGALVLMQPAPPVGAVALHWLDTPGLRQSSDAIEQRAIELAGRVIRQADLLVAMRAPDIAWPDLADLPRPVDVWLMNKIDDGAEIADGSGPQAPLAISARAGTGLGAMQKCVLNRLSLADITDTECWAFSSRLRKIVAERNWQGLGEYCGGKRRSDEATKRRRGRM